MLSFVQSRPQTCRKVRRKGSNQGVVRWYVAHSFHFRGAVRLLKNPRATMGPIPSIGGDMIYPNHIPLAIKHDNQKSAFYRWLSSYRLPFIVIYGGDFPFPCLINSEGTTEFQRLSNGLRISFDGRQIQISLSEAWCGPAWTIPCPSHWSTTDRVW